MRGAFLLSLVVAVVAVTGCLSVQETGEDEIQVIGSDTMLELGRRLAEGYMRTHPGVSIHVSGGGSGVGIEALIDGRAEIAAASRPLASDEVAALHEEFGTLGVRYLIAQDALSVFLNEKNDIRNLSLDQLRGMFDGTTMEWAEIGGGSGKVVVFVRPPSSGTHRFFSDHVLSGAQYSPEAVTVPTSRGVLAAVQGDPYAIGYGGLAYRLAGVVQIAVDGIEPTTDNVRRGRYPLARYLVFYTAEPPIGLARRFIDWCLSAEGQRVVAEVGFFSLWGPDP